MDAQFLEDIKNNLSNLFIDYKDNKKIDVKDNIKQAKYFKNILKSDTNIDIDDNKLPVSIPISFEDDNDLLNSINNNKMMLKHEINYRTIPFQRHSIHYGFQLEVLLLFQLFFLLQLLFYDNSQCNIVQSSTTQLLWCCDVLF